MGVPSTSPLSSYLSRGDVIVSVDGVRIHNAQKWMDTAALVNELSLNDRKHNMDIQSFGTVSSRKGYCVPNPMIKESKQMVIVDNQSSCPDGLTAFTTVPCAYASISGYDHLRNIEKTYCLIARDIVKLNKCGDGWPPTITNGSNCICSQVGIWMLMREAISGLLLCVSVQINIMLLNFTGRVLLESSSNSWLNMG